MCFYKKINQILRTKKNKKDSNSLFHKYQKTTAKWNYTNYLELITRIRNNMKNSLIPMSDKILLRKRSVIETVNDELKNICQVEHSRHRSVINFMCNLIAGIIAYQFLPKKTEIKYESVNTGQLALY